MFGLRVGSAAPELSLPAADGSGTYSLSAARGRPVLVSFLGPAHCNFCRAHLVRAIQHQDDLKRLGADVVLVAYDDPERLTAKMMRDLDVPFTLLIDSGRELYRTWGLGQASWRNWLSPGLYVAAARAMIRRDEMFAIDPGPVQLGGDFVVDRTGRLAFVNVMRSFHDRAPMPVLIGALAKT